MKIAEWLTTSVQALKANDIPTARLDCLVLLEDQLDKNRAHILSHTETELTATQLKVLNQQVRKRLKHIPLAFIRGKTEFYGREFIINDAVLEPRPESETMFDLIKQLPIPQAILDIGTGSGALAVTAKLEYPQATVLATDIDPSCLGVAKKNAGKHDVSIDFRQGNLLEPILINDFRTLTILANLPYVPNDYKLNEAAMNEPKLAIFGGPDGLDLYRQLFNQLASASAQSLYILTESLPFQHNQLRSIAEDYGFRQVAKEDFIQVFEFN